MHIKKIYLLFLFLTLFYSCRNNKGNSESLSLDFKVKSETENILKIYYILNSDDSFTEELSIEKNILPSPNFQKINFQIPKGAKPKNIRLDLTEIEGKQISISELTIKYKSTVFVEKFENSFKIYRDIFNEANESSYIVIKESAHLDPYFIGNRKLNSLLVKAFPPDIYEINTKK